MPIVRFDVPVADRYLEDYPVGAREECGPITVTQEEIIAFAEKFDPQPFHVDSEAASGGPFGGLIASGWHTTALMMRQFADHYLSPIASLGGPGVDELRWTAPVRPGDSLRLRVTVLESRRSRSKPDRGLLRSRAEMFNQHSDTVLRLTVLNLLRTRPVEGP
jgi:acyl dehydratase